MSEATKKYLEKAGAILIRERNGNLEVLLGHRDREFDDWTFPKGKVEDGETVEETAIREVREETGFEITLLEKIPEIYYEFGGNTVKMTIFLGNITSGKEKISWENDKLKWIEYNKALKLLSYDNLKRSLKIAKQLLAGQKIT